MHARMSVLHEANKGRLLVLNNTHGLSMRFCLTDSSKRSAWRGLPQGEHRHPANTDQNTMCIETHSCMLLAGASALLGQAGQLGQI